MGQLEDLADMAYAIGASDLPWEEKAKNLRGLHSQARAAEGQQQVWYRPGHKHIYQTLSAAMADSQPSKIKHVDSIDVTEREKRKKITGSGNDMD